MAIDPNGDLAVALPSGELTLYKSDGQPDSQFTPVNTGLGGPVAVQPDGKVLVAGDVQVSDNGYYGYLDEIAVKRYNADGTPDSTFGDAGTAIVPILGQDGEEDFPAALLVQSDGSIAVVGTAWAPMRRTAVPATAARAPPALPWGA